MALVEIRRSSDVLEKRVGMFVLLPDVGEPPYPTLYLLHGLTDDYTGWVRKSRIEFYLRELPLIVVMPDGFRGWYTRNEQGRDYARYLVDETVGYVERFFPSSHRRGIGGLSMGGYGALLAALSNPGRFLSATSHSGALIPWERDPAFAPSPEWGQIFGEQPIGSGHDILAAARDCSAPPAIRFDCGLDDAPWLEVNRKVHRELGLPHEYAEYPGGHDWDYWDLQVREALRFHGRYLIP